MSQKVRCSLLILFAIIFFVAFSLLLKYEKIYAFAPVNSHLSVPAVPNKVASPSSEGEFSHLPLAQEVEQTPLAFDFRNYSSTLLGINLKYPSTWNVDELKNGIQLKSTKESTYVEVRVNKPHGHSNLKDYAINDIEDRMHSRKKFQLIDNISPATIGAEYQGYKATYSFSVTSDLDKRVLRYWFLENNKVYSLAYVSNSSIFANGESIAEAVIDSIKSSSRDQKSNQGAYVMVAKSGKDQVKGSESDSEAFDSKQRDSPDQGIESFTISFAATDRRNLSPVSPPMLTVEAGTMVIWINDDTVPHKIISGTPIKGPTNAFYSNEIEPNDRFTFDTSSLGTYEFYDPHWPNVKGVLHVVG